MEALDFAADTVGARVLGFDALLIFPTGWAEDWPQSAVPYEAGEEGVRFHLPFWDRLNARLDAARDRSMGHYVMLYSDDKLNLAGERATLEARWYNPRSGEYSGEPQQVGGMERAVFTAPTRGTREDWVLHVHSKID